MNKEFITIAQRLIEERGKDVLLNPAKCKALLADYTGTEYQKERRLFTQAVEAGVGKAISSAPELELCKKQQVRHLTEEFFLAEEIAADVVETLALLLRGDTASVRDASKPVKKPQAAASDSAQTAGKTCPKCGFELKPNWIKCPKCKTPVVEEVLKCQHCGEELEDWMDECPACGKAVVREAPAKATQERPPVASSPSPRYSLQNIFKTIWPPVVSPPSPAKPTQERPPVNINVPTNGQVYERLRSMVADKLEIDKSKITLNASFRRDLGADSLDAYELVYAVEEEFGIEIPDEIAEEFETVRDAYEFIIK
jgi:acyl carrier protein